MNHSEIDARVRSYSAIESSRSVDRFLCLHIVDSSLTIFTILLNYIYVQISMLDGREEMYR